MLIFLEHFLNALCTLDLRLHLAAKVRRVHQLRVHVEGAHHKVEDLERDHRLASQEEDVNYL